MSVTTTICWPRQAQSALPSQRIPCLHTPLFAFLLSAHSEKQPHIFTPALKACLWERKPKGLPQPGSPNTWMRNNMSFHDIKESLSLSAYSVCGQWGARPMFQVNTAPCGLLFSSSYQNGQKRGSNIQGRKVRTRAKTGTAMSHKTLASQVLVQPTGLSHLLPWVEQAMLLP